MGSSAAGDGTRVRATFSCRMHRRTGSDGCDVVPAVLALDLVPAVPRGLPQPLPAGPGGCMPGGCMPAGTADRELLAVACVLGLPPLLGVPGLPAPFPMPAADTGAGSGTAP